MRDIRKVVSENATRYFEESDMTKTGLAHYLNTGNVSYIQRILDGKANPGLTTLSNLAKALDVKVIDLVEDWEE